MLQGRGYPASRRLLWWFVATTLIPAAGLAALGWWIAAQDRALEGQRAEAQRDQAAELAATALQRTLAELENRLVTAAANPGAAARIDAGVAVLVFDSQQLVERAGLALPYYPGLPHSPLADERLARADALEFHDRNPAGAIRALEPLRASADKTVAAGALLRIARNQEKLGESVHALETFDRLSSFRDTRIDGWPAPLRARQARALLFAGAGRRDELAREAAAVAQDVRDGRFLLTRAQYEFTVAQIGDWLGDDTPSPLVDQGRLALAQAAEDVWQDRQSAVASKSTEHPRQTRWTGDRSVLVLTRVSDRRIAFLFAGRQFLEDAWRRPLRAGVLPAGLDVALSDADGRAVLGNPGVPPANQSVRTVSATQLPWTVHAIGALRPATAFGLSGPAKLMLTAVGFMTIVVIAGGYVVNRAVAREIAVARLQSDFVTAVSHEFRTPLTTLRHLSELLVQRRVSSDARREQFYETLLRESGRLHRLVEGLLNFARLEAGELEYRFDVIDLRAFLETTAAEVQAEVAGHGYRIEFRSDERPVTIRADHELLARVFWNLLDNAVKYSPSNRLVEIHLSASTSEATVRVFDHGIGIPANEQADIFRKFSRGAAARRSAIRGTGIGLAMAREIVRGHGGDIVVESAVDHGSTFSVTLPVVHVT